MAQNKKQTDNINDKKQKNEKKKSPMNPIQIFLLNFLTVITVLWLLFGYVVGVINAPNSDMSPNIKSSDLLLYYKLYKNYRAQDVVVLVKNDTTYVGRIVAVGGDSVDISDSERLIVNGNMVSEPNIFGDTPRFEGFVQYPVQLGDNEYFILCDSRGGSEDSRYYGTVSADDIRGKVISIVRRSNL
ncbi:MAG: signal peptidase I [Ruminococcus sp.]|uniref:signal peptidase I n=1 Tax=Ruminococcus sp. TaxID=41978 RepID=UPI0025E86B04|nr:signal peptidase I [Ruminococcus sp.]MCR5600746.1 signal peptidase I [Ruminococcus sp.]